ncbi:protein NLRC3-like isoform X2 [Hypomesus transpacificus]|uniref:protein NLRC3-like isoform X2 n=1 Tax=Hypomesus transpacificus TaxID=137520 RepID=UPI001F07F16F|nr:protein NLRC3-like isoform X2 [Hypomesus transpacificus]
MDTSNEEQLLGTLKKLGDDDLKTFQWFLKKKVLDGFDPIPKSRLEGAARTDTVDRMVEIYRPEGALKITVEILRKMDQNNFAKWLMSVSDAEEAGGNSSTSCLPQEVQGSSNTTETGGHAAAPGGNPSEHATPWSSNKAQDGSIFMAPVLKETHVAGNLTLTTTTGDNITINHNPTTYNITQNNKEIVDHQKKESTSQDPQGSETPPFILKLKKALQESFKTKFKYLFEGTTEDETTLNSFFIQLYMTTGESEGVNKEHEIMQIEYPSTGKTSSERSIHYSEIFSPLDEKETKILTVLTKGIPGIGKTISVHMFILDWAEGKSNQDIDLIFVLPFRELNLIKDDLSLHGLLKEFHPEIVILNEVEDAQMFNNHKVLFILDGMDESRCPLDFHNNERVSDVTKKCPVDFLLTNIMKKSLLPSALLWITSRPGATSQIPRRTVKINRETEVCGFQGEQRLEYFRKRFSDDEDLANRIIEHMRTTRSLYIMCYIPIMCWIIAEVLKDMLRQNNSGHIPQSLTEMYIHFLITQTQVARQKYQGETIMDKKKVLELRKDLMLKLGQVAFEQLVKRSVVFYEEDLRTCGIDVDEAAVKCGLCTEILKLSHGLYKKKMYCFVHLSFQEFLAALYVFYRCVTKNISALESFLENVSAEQPLHELLKRIVDKALQSENGHLDLFLRFLFGISLESNQTLLQGLLPQTENTSETVEDMRKYLRKPDVENISPERQVNLFLCLTEMNDSSVHEDIHQFLMSPDREEDAVSSDHCSALANALLMSQGELDEMDQRKYNTDMLGRNRLVPAVRKYRKAVLTDMLLSHEDCALLASFLQSAL